MVISRTPFRISFFGGGTDFPAWYRENGGSVLSTTIDKYCYISCRRLPPFFEYRHRIVYSKFEQVNEIKDILHPAVREVYRFMKVKEGLEMHHDGDLPARTGLGSSSSFTVGLLHALYGLKGKMVTKKKLSLDAIHVEQDMIRENVGSQDQVAVAFGGLNQITFSGEHNIEVRPITIKEDRLREFNGHLVLFFTGFTRFASEIEADKIKQLVRKKADLRKLHRMVGEAIGLLNSHRTFVEFGRMLDESWKIKRTLSHKVSNPHIDEIYRVARKNGAVGGKILGAGGGGFMLFLARPEDRDQLKKALADLLYVPFRFDTLGSQIVYYSESGV